MPIAQDIFGTVFQDSSAILMARVVDSGAQTINRTSVASLLYSVYELDKSDPESLLPVMGHENVLLTVDEVIYDALQNDSFWTIDATGYNFRHEIDVAANEAFPKAGAVYQIRYELTPVLGQKIVFRFQLRCI